MRIAIVGCGYIAASYANALPHHPELELVGAWDIDAQRLDAFVKRYGGRAFASEAKCLENGRVDTIANLTNPRVHHAITSAALRAGKHVWSEKPLAMNGAEAKSLVDLARERGLMLASAPCSALSETAETVRAALQAGVVGRPRLVYANFDDGMIAPRLSPWNWRNEVGAAWPARDEFEVGCTYEHAGYLLTWLASFFGPVRRVTSFAACLLPDKGIAVSSMAPDFTTGCLEYDDGVVARLTCSLVAPEDKSLTIIGDLGALRVDNVRHERCPVRYRTWTLPRIGAAIERRVNALCLSMGLTALREGWTSWRSFPYVAPPPRWLAGRKPVDFLRGLSEMAAALRERRACRLPAELGWHVAEIIDALQSPAGGSEGRVIESRFPPIGSRFDPPEATRRVRTRGEYT
jgi:predicted dehydrogenase